MRLIFGKVFKKFISKQSYFADNPDSLFIEFKKPSLRFTVLERQFEYVALVEYSFNLNTIIINIDKLEVLASNPALLEQVLFHELGHAWFKQAPKSIQKEYYRLVISQKEKSLYGIT